MKPFRDTSIKRKLLWLNLTICGAVLFVATVVTLTFQVLNFRTNFLDDTATLAAVIANNSTAALAFNDAKGGAEVVNSLRDKPTVVGALLVNTSGATLARFGGSNHEPELSMFPPAGGHRFINGHLLYTAPVELNGKQLGKLYLRANYRKPFLGLLGLYASVVGGVLIASILLVTYLSGQLGRIITLPVLKLADTARKIGEQHDYSVRAPVERQNDEIGRLAESFNEMLDRIQSQDTALNLSQQKMEMLIHSIDGIVWEWKPDPFQYTFVSRQTERLLGYPPEAWLNDPRFWQEKICPADAAKAVRTREEMVARGQPYSFEYRMVAADDRTVWIRESGVVLVEKDQPVAARGIFQDITGQKTAAEQLEILNRKLVETSRHAGMAEVATGVLHNVGNVLNSVNVSATLVSKKLRKSKLTYLCRAASMLNQSNGHLAEFLTVDPKGKLLPEYLVKATNELEGEQNRLIEEMDSVAEHIEHIKHIVAMQQSYAKLSGANENLSAAELAEDALRMNLAAFERHRIQVIRQFDEKVPRVCVDRHKVLQILINLLRNAKYAMDRQETNGLLIVRIEQNTAEKVNIVVSDNGVGIAPKDLIKIFNHGFTTRRDGHGFGLHSGANAAKEMGGRLSVHSDGPGKGATFTLELPVEAPTSINTTGAIAKAI